MGWSGPMTDRQFVVWMYWLEDYYRKVNGDSPRPDREEETPKDIKIATNYAQHHWFSMMSILPEGLMKPKKNGEAK